MARLGHRLAGFGVVIALAALASPAAFGDDPKPTGKALEYQTAVEAHLSVRDTGALAADVASIAKYAPQASDANERSLLLNLVGRACAVNDDPLRLACLKAFQEMKDPAAWKYFDTMLVQNDPKRMDPMLQAVIDTCAVLTPEGAALKLINIYRDSDSLPACIACLKALCKYKQSKQRADILFAIIDEPKSVKPGAFGRAGALHKKGRTGEAARTRWDGLSGPAVEAANTLTGQSIGTIDDWIKTITDMKSELASCFLEPLEKKKSP